MDEARAGLERQVAELRAQVRHLEETARRSERSGEELRRSNDMLQLVMDTIPQFVFWKDRDSVYQGCNRNFAHVAGAASVEEIVGKTDYDLAWKTAEADFFRECDRRVMESDTPEFHILEPQLQADGKQAWLDTNKVPLHDAEGNVVGILGTYEDVTDRKTAEDALADSEENLRITLDSIGDAVIATDASGRVTRLNPVAESLTGWSSQDAKGLPLLKVFRIVNAHTRAPQADPVSKVLESGQVVGLANHTLLIARDGKELQIADSGAPIRNRKGEIVGVVLVFRDVTEQHEIEAKLRHSQKLESVGQLAGGVAHDFNNMLVGVQGAAELLALDLPADSPLSEYVELIQEAAQQAAELVEKLLAFSHKGDLANAPVDVHRCIESAVQLFRRSVDKRIDLSTHLEAEYPVVFGDAAQLQHAILNLCLNARDAMPAGGQVAISTAMITAEVAASLPELSEPGSYLEISVRDNGHGIPSTIRGRIFEPFFTTKAIGKGTGLGLSAVYGTVARHGGVINVLSDLGHGTVFKVYLPAQPDATEVGKALLTQVSREGGGRVLVVDDEPIVRRVTQRLLIQLGREVSLAESGQEALEIYGEEGSRIDLVLLDMVMPGLSGRETFDRLRAIDPEVKVVCSSGFSRDDRIDDALAHGVLDFLKKPYSLARLNEVLARHLPRSG